jgi:hypothetical protein
MHRDFRRRQGDDEPATAGVNGGQLEDVAEEAAGIVGLGALDDHMGPVIMVWLAFTCR